MNINLIFDILQNISIVIVSFVAIYGINSWRTEMVWKRKYELAEEVLSLFYEARESIEIIRSPYGHTGEGKTRKRKEKETEEQSEILDRAYVIYERYEKVKTPFTKLKSLKYRFMAIFGEDKGLPFDNLSKLLDKLFFASYKLEKYWNDQGRKKFTDEQFQKHVDKMEKFEEIIWSDYGEPDLISEEINKVVENIETICKTIIQKK
ncbi:MAG: hypothetical protein DRI87_02355 [Bacteroidetes bacterium]|nr:MAG: hypothetical protein DRI87_02355 [Bacteroidota bacterium]